MKLNKRLCDICRESFVPWHIKRVHNHNLCPACLKLVLERQDEWLVAVGVQRSRLGGTTLSRPQAGLEATNPQDTRPTRSSGQVPGTMYQDNPIVKPVEANIAGIALREGQAFFDEIRSVSRIISVEFITVMFARISFYLGTFSCFSDKSLVYAVSCGAMAADLVTWVMLNILQLPFMALRFGIEFGAYSVMLGYLGAGRDLFNVPDNPEQLVIAAFAFFGVGIAKIAWWATKVFAIEEPAEDI